MNDAGGFIIRTVLTGYNYVVSSRKVHIVNEAMTTTLCGSKIGRNWSTYRDNLSVWLNQNPKHTTIYCAKCVTRIQRQEANNRG